MTRGRRHRLRRSVGWLERQQLELAATLERGGLGDAEGELLLEQLSAVSRRAGELHSMEQAGLLDPMEFVMKAGQAAATDRAEAELAAARG